MIKVTITITAADVGDAAQTLEGLIATQINDGFIEGYQRNEDGAYRYEVTEYTA